MLNATVVRAAMARAVTERTKVIYIANPNNPTGTMVASGDMDRFLDALPPRVLVVLDEAYREFVTDPDAPDGIDLLPELDKLYKHRVLHDPSDLDGARRLAEPDGRIRLGIFYRNERLPVYEDVRAVPMRSAAEKVAALNEELDHYAV